MQLQDNEHITEAVSELLLADNWTMEKLATTQPATLEKYKGIGKVTASAIVSEAKRLVNQERLAEALFLYAPPVEELPQVSARVRRIQESIQQ